MTQQQDRLTVQQAADKYQQPPKKLLDALRRQFPESDWTLNSLLPENFEQMVEQHRQEYEETQAPDLPKGAITTATDAAKDNALMLEAIEYGVFESLAQLRNDDIIYRAKIDALTDIQTYEEAYAQVMNGYHNKKVQNRTQQLQEMEARLKASMLGRNQTVGNLQTGLIQETRQAQTQRTAQNNELTAIIEALTSQTPTPVD